MFKFFLEKIKDVASGQILKWEQEHIEDIGSCIGIIPDSLLNEEICFLAVTYDWKNLRHVPIRFMTSRVIKAGLRQCGYALFFVPRGLRSEEYCNIAVGVNGGALALAPKEVITFKMAKVAVNDFGLSINYVPERIMCKELCMDAYNKNPHALKLLKEKYTLSRFF